LRGGDGGSGNFWLKNFSSFSAPFLILVLELVILMGPGNPHPHPPAGSFEVVVVGHLVGLSIGNKNYPPYSFSED
jgi:hypothetical protein